MEGDLSKREVIFMDSESIKGWQFGCVSGCWWVNMVWGPFWVRLGVRLGVRALVFMWGSFLVVLLSDLCTLLFYYASFYWHFHEQIYRYLYCKIVQYV